MSKNLPEQETVCFKVICTLEIRNQGHTLYDCLYQIQLLLWNYTNCKLFSLKLAKDLVDLESLISKYLALFFLGGLLLMPDRDKFKERW